MQQCLFQLVLNSLATETSNFRSSNLPMKVHCSSTCNHVGQSRCWYLYT